MLPELSFAFAFSQNLKTDGQEIPHLVSSFIDPRQHALDKNTDNQRLYVTSAAMFILYHPSRPEVLSLTNAQRF
jgi:hypothetical protein